MQYIFEHLKPLLKYQETTYNVTTTAIQKCRQFFQGSKKSLWIQHIKKNLKDPYIYLILKISVQSRLNLNNQQMQTYCFVSDLYII